MDFGPVYQQLITAFWYLIPLVIIAGLIKSPWFKGKVGEFLVNLSARCFLDKFQNPLHQNYKHVKTLQALPGLGVCSLYQAKNGFH